MHEMGLAEGILGSALGIAQGRPVRRVTVRVGALQRVVPDSLEFSFQLAAAGTEAAGARFEVVGVAATARCAGCGLVQPLDGGVHLCRGCGEPGLQALGGDEVLLDEVELDDGTILRRPGATVTEAPHAHPHAGDDGGLPGGGSGRPGQDRQGPETGATAVEPWERQQRTGGRTT